MSTPLSNSMNEFIVIEVFDGDKSLGFTATTLGKPWSMNLINLALGEHQLTGKIASTEVTSLRWNTVVGNRSDTEDFENVPEGSKPIGSIIKMNSMTVVAESSISIVQAGNGYAPATTGKICYLPAHGSVTITFNRPVRSFTFGIADGSNIPSRVVAYDSSGALVLSGSTPVYGGSSQVWASFKTPSSPIKTIRITDGGGDSYIDNFTLNY